MQPSLHAKKKKSRMSYKGAGFLLHHNGPLHTSVLLCQERCDDTRSSIDIYIQDSSPCTQGNWQRSIMPYPCPCPTTLPYPNRLPLCGLPIQQEPSSAYSKSCPSTYPLLQPLASLALQPSASSDPASALCVSSPLR